jgi:ABC-type sugar transport system ATPase subunit
MNSSDLVISTEGLSKLFGQVQALKALDLRVHPRLIFAFLGLIPHLIPMETLK